MAIFAEILKEILQQQQQHFDKSQLQLITTFNQQFENSTKTNDSVDLLSNNIMELNYDATHVDMQLHLCLHVGKTLSNMNYPIKTTPGNHAFY